MTLFWERELPVTDRGLAYGDGCFETLRFRDGLFPLARYHRQRLVEGAARLGIPFDPDNFDRALEQARAGSAGEGVLKLVLTRGSGGRGYGAPPAPSPRLLCALHPLPQRSVTLRREGMELVLSPVRLAEQPALAGIKHLNRLEQVTARLAADRAGVDEALMPDSAGRPVELTSMNLFARFGDRLWTPPLDRCGVAGVARAHILSVLAPEAGLKVQMCPRTLSQLHTADEVFACNSVAGVVPVRKLGLWRWPAGDVTRALQDALERLWKS